MRLLAVLAVMAALAPAIADAHHSPTSRLHNMRHIAQEYWGDGKCAGVTPMTIPIGRGPMPLDHPEWLAYIMRGPGPPYEGCRIVLKDWGWQTEYLCRVIVHEVGHEAGMDHSPDRFSIMWHGDLAPFGPCANGAAEPSRRAEVEAAGAASPPRGPLVLLVPGGGWQNAQPSTMDPWLHDFRKHGFDARAITYPLRDVLGAVEHVRQIAAAETRPVVCYGISAGGTICAALAARGLVAGAVNIAGPTDFERWVGIPAWTIKRQIGMRTRAQMRAASPFYMLRGAQTSQLVQCGAIDPLVTIDQCERYKSAAWRGNHDTTYQRMIAGHNQWSIDRDRARAWIAARWPSS